jgi:stress-induced morphogen
MPKHFTPCQSAGGWYSWRIVLDADEIRRSLEHAFPGATVAAADSTGAGDHFAVTVVSAAFAGKSLVERHQLVYGALAPLMARIHALQLKTMTPGER